jgi:hypothetical protein
MKIKNDNQTQVVDIQAENVGTSTTFVSNNQDEIDELRLASESHLRKVALPGMKEGKMKQDAPWSPEEAAAIKGEWRIKRTPATFRRIQTLGLSDAKLTEMLKTHQGRINFGYNYIQRIN